MNSRKAPAMKRKLYKKQLMVWLLCFLASFANVNAQQITWRNRTISDPSMAQAQFNVDNAQCQIMTNQTIPPPLTQADCMHLMFNLNGGALVQGTIGAQQFNGTIRSNPPQECYSYGLLSIKEREGNEKRNQLYSSCMVTRGWVAQ